MVTYNRSEPNSVDSWKGTLSIAYFEGVCTVLTNFEENCKNITEKGEVSTYAESTRELCSLLDELADVDRDRIMNLIKSLLSDE